SEGYGTTLIVVKPDQFGMALLEATGSQAHLRKLELVAAKKRKLTSKRISKTAAAKHPKTETEIYRRLGMQYVAPELREVEGEIEAALRGKLPEDLITTDDIRGMVHCHTTYSDGKHSVEQMVATAESMGMRYITITDHSPTAFYAGGVKIDRLQRQWEEID